MTDVPPSDPPKRAGSSFETQTKAGLNRWWFPWLLLVIAVVYYGCYALSGLDLGGEGGTTALIAQRLLDGQRPFVDTFLGYNLLWFYPLVWLFQIFGPNFTVVRIFSFGLSIITALLAYRTVRRATNSSLLAFVCGLVLILIPGIQFRNFLGLLGVGNLAALIEAFGLPHRSPDRRLGWIMVSALAIALTFLIRIDLGFFFSVVGLASLFAYLLLGDESAKWRLRNGIVTLVALPVAFTIVHLPVSYYAAQRGFSGAFWESYLSFWQFVEDKATSVVTDEPPQLNRQVRFSPSIQPVADEKTTVPVTVDRTTRKRPAWTQMFTEKFGKRRILVFLLYYPVLSGGILALWALILALYGLVRNQPSAKRDALILMIGLGSAFTLFPQYFFFRPDPQHLSEMMCPFLVVGACSFGIAFRRFFSPGVWSRWSARLWTAFLLLHLWFYLDYGLAVPWMGSIGRKKPNEQLFKADNGVLAYLPKEQKPDYDGLYQAITHNSAATDWVVCYPYAPTINFMTNRRSYLYNLYVDNATRPAAFDTAAIAAIQEKKPAVIVINDDPINATESSRFSVWAATTLAYIKSHYRYFGTYVRNDVYVAPSQ